MWVEASKHRCGLGLGPTWSLPEQAPRMQEFLSIWWTCLGEVITWCFAIKKQLRCSAFFSPKWSLRLACDRNTLDVHCSYSKQWLSLTKHSYSWKWLSLAKKWELLVFKKLFHGIFMKFSGEHCVRKNLHNELMVPKLSDNALDEVHSLQIQWTTMLEVDGVNPSDSPLASKSGITLWRLRGEINLRNQTRAWCHHWWAHLTGNGSIIHQLGIWHLVLLNYGVRCKFVILLLILILGRGWGYRLGLISLILFLVVMGVGVSWRTVGRIR